MTYGAILSIICGYKCFFFFSRLPLGYKDVNCGGQLLLSCQSDSTMSSSLVKGKRRTSSSQAAAGGMRLETLSRLLLKHQISWPGPRLCPLCAFYWHFWYKKTLGLISPCTPVMPNFESCSWPVRLNYVTSLGHFLLSQSWGFASLLLSYSLSTVFPPGTFRRHKCRRWGHGRSN